MLGVTNELPVNILVPPVEVVYQFTTPALAVAFNVTEPVLQRLAAVVPVIVGGAPTVTITVSTGELHELAHLMGKSI